MPKVLWILKPWFGIPLHWNIILPCLRDIFNDCGLPDWCQLGYNMTEPAKLAHGDTYISYWCGTVCCAEKNQKNIEKHTAHTIVSLPNPKQWQMGHTSKSMMIIRSSTGILTIIIRKMGKQNIQSPVSCMEDHSENWHNLRHTLERDYIWQIF